MRWFVFVSRSIRTAFVSEHSNIHSSPEGETNPPVGVHGVVVRKTISSLPVRSNFLTTRLLETAV